MIVSPNKLYTFKDMNIPTLTMKGDGLTKKELIFRLPADFLIKPNVYADLVLYFSYGAGGNAKSALVVTVNDTMARTILLSDSKGDVQEGYKIRIPTFMFKPGKNIIRFDAALIPLVTTACEKIALENLYLSIYENSTFIIPEMPHFTELPKLELFMLNGFPVTRWPDGKGSTIFLANKDGNTISAALNLIGVITQKNGYLLLETQISYVDPKKFEGELIIIGDMKSIPDNYVKAAPLKLTTEKAVQYQISKSWGYDINRLFSKQKYDFKPGKGAFMEFLSPYTEGRSVIMMTAVTTQELLTLSDALTDAYL